MITPGEMERGMLVAVYEERKPKPTSQQNPSMFGMMQPFDSSPQVMGWPMQILAVNIPFIVVSFFDKKNSRYMLDTRKFNIMEISPEFIVELSGLTKQTIPPEVVEAIKCTKDLELPFMSVGKFGSQCQCPECRAERAKNEED